VTFLTPALAIAGVVGVLVPIVIHLLFRRRRAPIEWAAMRFLLEAVQTRRRRLQMEQLLLLLVRCLLIGLLGMALARPLLTRGSSGGPSGPDTMVIVIDDGLVSALEDERGETALERHVGAATELIRGLDQTQGVSIVTAARPATVLVDPPSHDHDATLGLLRSLEPSNAPSDLEGALRRAIDLATRTAGDLGRAEVVVLSEFRAGSAQIEEPLPPMIDEATARAVRLVAATPTTEPVTNVQVRAVTPLRSVIVPGAVDGSGQVAVDVRRTGGGLEAEVSTVTLSIGDAPAAEPRTIEWSPGQVEADVDFLLELELETDREIGLSAAADRDRLPIDDAAHAVVELRRRIRAGLIERRGFGAATSDGELTAGQWIRRALEPGIDGPIEFVEIEPGAVNPVDLRLTDLAIAPRPDLLDEPGWSALRRFVDRGGLLLVVPPADQRVHQWTETMIEALDLPIDATLEVIDEPDGLGLAEEQPRVGLLRLISSELADLLAPVRITRRLVIGAESAEVEVPLVLADGTPLLVVAAPSSREENGDGEPTGEDRSARASGLVAVMAVAPVLDWTNLPSKPLMVPLFQEIVRQGLSRIGAGRSMILGDAAGPTLPPAASEVVGPGGDRHEITRNGSIDPPLRDPGLHEILDAGGRSIGRLAVNVDAEAGRTEVQSREVVESWLLGAGPVRWLEDRDAPVEVADVREVSPVARWLLWTVLGLAIVESLLARRFSHALRGGALPSVASARWPRGPKRRGR